jgi:hypothetical protein
MYVQFYNCSTLIQSNRAAYCETAIQRDDRRIMMVFVTGQWELVADALFYFTSLAHW